jgi:hypothetical protein
MSWVPSFTFVGDKRTQRQDIKQAKELAEQL